MHPPYPVIFSTTASGAGYGLIVWLSIFGALGLVPATRPYVVVGLGLALLLVVAGLLSSTGHPGRHERSWRALSQWRTSWLSREGVAAVATLATVGGLAFVWYFGGRVHPIAWLAAALSIVTVYCTGMIDQSLPNRASAGSLTAPVHVALSLATGGVLFNLVLALLGRPTQASIVLAVAALALAWVLKGAYWSRIDEAARTTSAGRVTEHDRHGNVRPIKPPHVQGNIEMRDMGNRVTRKDALDLRGMAAWLLFALPVLILIGLLLAGDRVTALPLVVATVSAAIGVGIERWLFFAEAEHKVMTYYGQGSA